MGSGTKTVAGSAAARGADAAGRAVERAVERCADAPELVLAFTSGLDPAPAAAELAAAAGSARCVGLTGKGVLGPDGIVDEGCAAIAFGPQVKVGIGVRDKAGADLRSATEEATAEALEAVTGAEHLLVLLFIDTPRSDHADAVAGAYAAAGPGVPIAGGGAGGPETALLDDAAINEAVVAVALAAPKGIGLGTSHGCVPVAAPATVSRSDGLVVTELDRRPASDVYLERLGYDGTALDDKDFEELAVTHPLGEVGEGDERRLRHIRWREGTALVCATHLPNGTRVEFTHQAPADIIAASSRAVDDSLNSLGHPPGAALIFDCAGRKRAIGSSLGLESSALYAAFEEVPPIAGAFTYGEIARTHGPEGDRNHAIVVATLA